MGELAPTQIGTNTGEVGSPISLVDVDPPNGVPGLPALDARLLTNLAAALGRPAVHYEESETESTRTQVSYAEKLKLTLAVPPGGPYPYLVEWSCEVVQTSRDEATFVRMQLDDTNTFQEVGVDSEKTLVGWVPLSGFKQFSLASGIHDVDLDWASGKDGKTAKVRRARIKAMRVTEA